MTSSDDPCPACEHDDSSRIHTCINDRLRDAAKRGLAKARQALDPEGTDQS